VRPFIFKAHSLASTINISLVCQMKNYVQQARSLRRNIYMKTRRWKNLRPQGTKHEIDGKIDGKIGIEIENETNRIECENNVSLTWQRSGIGQWTLDIGRWTINAKGHSKIHLEFCAPVDSSTIQSNAKQSTLRPPRTHKTRETCKKSRHGLRPTLEDPLPMIMNQAKKRYTYGM